MEVTDVRIYLQSKADTKLKAYATITLDHAFVVRNVKVIEGSKGLFVAMPSERVKEPCPKCGFRNALRSRFCNQCGGDLSAAAGTAEGGHMDPADLPAQAGNSSEHRDIAHPITVECREAIQRKVLEAYEKARAQANQPNIG